MKARIPAWYLCSNEIDGVSVMVAINESTVQEQPAEPTQEIPAVRRGGPRSTMGKSRSSLNAIRHGITSRRDLLPWEDTDGYEKFVQDRLDFFDMETRYEQELVRELAGHEWRLRRLDNYETTVMLKQAVEAVIDPELRMGRPIPAFDHDPEMMEGKFSKLYPMVAELEAMLEKWPSLGKNKVTRFVTEAEIQRLYDFLNRAIVLSRWMETLEDRENVNSWPQLALKAKDELSMACREAPRNCHDPGKGFVMADFQLLRIEDAFRQLHQAGLKRLSFLRSCLPAATERSKLIEDVPLISAAVPAPEELEKMTRYRHYIERCIRNCLSRIEAARVVKERVKSSNIRKIA